MSSSSTRSPKNILIVEDDMLLCLVEERLVEKLGHNVIAKAGSGEEAVKKSKTLKPDLIIMDIVLKGEMDGIEAMETIRKESDVPVIYLSGNSDRFNYERAKKTGFAGYLVKPITSKDLKRPLKKAFSGEGKQNMENSEIDEPESGDNSIINQTA